MLLILSYYIDFMITVMHFCVNFIVGKTKQFLHMFTDLGDLGEPVAKACLIPFFFKLLRRQYCYLSIYQTHDFIR